jgi:hypothetical protein
MKWPAFNFYDFFMTLIFGVQLFYVFTNWTNFNCQEPINLWFALDWIILYFARMIFVVGYSEYSKKVRSTSKWILYALWMPIMMGWSIMGTIWINEEGTVCIPQNMVPWSFYLWLAISWLSTLVLALYGLVDLKTLIQLNAYLKDRPDRDNDSLLGNSR